jgi:hypothetical protein
MGEVSWEQELNENQGVLSTDHPSIHPSICGGGAFVGGWFTLAKELHGSSFS